MRNPLRRKSKITLLHLQIDGAPLAACGYSPSHTDRDREEAAQRGVPTCTVCVKSLLSSHNDLADEHDEMASRLNKILGLATPDHPASPPNPSQSTTTYYQADKPWEDGTVQPADRTGSIWIAMGERENVVYRWSGMRWIKSHDVPS